MRIDIDLDQSLIQEAQRLTGMRTKRAVVHEALRVLIEVRKRRRLPAIAGRSRFADDYDHKAAREAS